MIGLLAACAGTEPVVPEAPAPDPPPVAGSVDRTARLMKPASRNPAWAEARCNDGTPFAYGWRPGLEPVWVVNLSGGYFCDDAAAPCADRNARLTTTLPGNDGGVVRRMRSQGVFDPDPATNPTFAHAHHVDAHYCSSDLWLGRSTERRPTTGDPEAGWYFSGARNVEVLFDALIQVHGLDDANPETRVLFLGTSAGGAGVVAGLDAVIAKLPKTAAAGRLKVVLDGSFVPKPAGPVTLPDAAKWGPVHPKCPGSDCVHGPTWWPHVAETGVPVLVQLSGQDRTQTPVFGVDTAEEAAVWQAATRSQLEALPWVFSGGHAYHVVATEPLWAKGPAGNTFREVLDRFWAGGEPEQVFFRY